MFEVTTQPGAGPPPHIHHREDEAFYVLDGEDQFLSGEETLRVGAGSLLYVPKGTLHAHEKVGGGMGRMLMTQTPGGLYELFFEKAGRRPANGDQGESPAFEDRPEAGRITEMAAEHGIEIPSLMGKGYRSWETDTAVQLVRAKEPGDKARGTVVSTRPRSGKRSRRSHADPSPKKLG